MVTNIIWVPKPGGTTWNSNRTRDLVDLAFTIEVQSDGLAMVTIRCSKSDEENSRAKTVIGRVYFDSASIAKKVIPNLMEEANTKADRKSAREWLLTSMMAMGTDFSPSGAFLSPGVIIDGAWAGKSALGLATGKPSGGTTVEEGISAYDPDLFIPEFEIVDEPIAKTLSSGIYKVDPETDVWSPFPTASMTPLSEIADDLVKAIAAKRAAVAMKESVEAVMEVVAPVVEPEPNPEVKVEIPQFITINGKQIPITWPK